MLQYEHAKWREKIQSWDKERNKEGSIDLRALIWCFAQKLIVQHDVKRRHWRRLIVCAWGLGRFCTFMITSVLMSKSFFTTLCLVFNKVFGNKKHKNYFSIHWNKILPFQLSLNEVLSTRFSEFDGIEIKKGTRQLNFVTLRSLLWLQSRESCSTKTIRQA